VTRQQESSETASTQIGRDADRPILVTGATAQQGGGQGAAAEAATRVGAAWL